MWYKLNEAIGIILLIAIVGGGAVYGLYKFVTGPPVLRQSDDESDPRQNAYMRDIMAEHDKAMQKIQQQIDSSMQEAMEVRDRAFSQ